MILHVTCYVGDGELVKVFHLFSTKKRPAFIPAIFILELSKQPDKEQIYIHFSPYKENNIKHICVISPSNKTTNKYAL